MNNEIIDIITIGGVIQSAVAPVFLITGVATLLGVLSNRLARVMERARHIELSVSNGQQSELRQLQFSELDFLWQRISLLNRSYSLCTVCALLLCIVIVILFASHVTATNLSNIIAVLFIVAMMCLIVGLIVSLREILLATRALKSRFKAKNLDNTLSID